MAETSNFITIVSGLPRTGTSMMMRMLAAGGMEIVVDQVRKPDRHNPDGYNEFEPVKKIKTDTSWLADTRGKAFKMVSMLLYELPLHYRYRVVFMQRHLSEVLASQRTMLMDQDRQALPDKKMHRIYQKHLVHVKRWMAAQDNLEVLWVHYNRILEAPQPELNRLNHFLYEALDASAMAKVVDASLYRHRKA